MKTLTTLIISLFMIYPTEAGAEIRADHQKHIWASASISTATYFALRNQGASKQYSFWGSMAFTTAVGALKELSDERFDWSDMGANAAGTVISLGICIRF